MQVAHEIVGEVHAAELDLGSGLADGADERAANAVVLEAEDVLDARAGLGADAVGRLLLVGERLVALTLLADVALVAGTAERGLGRLAAVRAVGSPCCPLWPTVAARLPTAGGPLPDPLLTLRLRLLPGLFLLRSDHPIGENKHLDQRPVLPPREIDLPGLAPASLSSHRGGSRLVQRPRCLAV